MGLKGRASQHLQASPDHAFGVITDVGGLPAWNERITGVVDAPAALTEGSQWVVGMSVMGKRFTSRSTVIEIDRSAHRFVYRSKREEDNPSFAIWTWTVEPNGGGSVVTLEWELRPATLLRKRVLAPMRASQIAGREAPASLAALARRCAP